MTRHLKSFFDGFCVNTAAVRIQRHPQAEFLVNSNAPARIIARRQTAAVDEEVGLSQILDPALQPVEKVTVRPARILFRRFTTAVGSDSPQPKASTSTDNGLDGITARFPRSLVFADNATSCVTIQSNIPTHSHQSNAGTDPIQRSNVRTDFPVVPIQQAIVQAVQIHRSNSAGSSTAGERRPLPELISIRGNQNQNPSNDSIDPVPNLAESPMQFAAYIENRLFGVDGILSKRTNMRKD